MQQRRFELGKIPTEPGVYVMKDRLGAVIYVGKAKNLRRRLTTYFRPGKQTLANLKTRALIESIEDYEVHVLRNEQEALLLENRLIKQWRPRYNIQFRDDKRFYQIRINVRLSMPRIELVRQRREDDSRYWGPFPNSNQLHCIVDWLNAGLQLRTCRHAEPGELQHQHCHADILKTCSAPCIGKISLLEYRERVQQAIDILDGKNKQAVLAELQQQMGECAAKLDFEQAAKLRDVQEALKQMYQPVRRFNAGLSRMLGKQDPLQALQALGEALGMQHPPHIMECFDISNISSTHIVASMVRFVDGVPRNSAYRRYRIKSVQGQDDFASMAEVIRRRYSRVLAESRVQEPNSTGVAEQGAQTVKGGSELADLIIVDGGKGQLGKAHEQLKLLGLEHVMLIGLAKQHEHIFFMHRSEPLILDHNSPELKLLQRIRDEAHRFANNYNELLMQKRMRESALDDIAGLSANDRLNLLKHFKSVNAISKADSASLCALRGISARKAENIIAYFAQHPAQP